jgi:hypothetical protein
MGVVEHAEADDGGHPIQCHRWSNCGSSASRRSTPSASGLSRSTSCRTVPSAKAEGSVTAIRQLAKRWLCSLHSDHPHQINTYKSNTAEQSEECIENAVECSE